MLTSLLIDVQNVEIDISDNLAIANLRVLSVSRLSYGVKV
jgi:hypothetical protein